MSVEGLEIIFFRRHRHGFRRRSYGWMSCGYLSLSCGFRHCSCFLSCGLNLMRSCLCCSCPKMSFSKRMSCFCYSYRSKRSFSKASCFCCSYRCWSSKRKHFWMRKSSAGVRIRSWSATDGCCWVRCSSGVRCFGCQCGHYSSWPDAAERRCCWCGRWCLLSDGWRW